MNSVLGNIHIIWQGIINAGVQKTFKGNTIKRIRLTNIMSVFLAFVSFPFAIFFSYLGYHFQGLGVFIVDILFLSAILFNYKKCYTCAKFLLLALVNFAAFPYELFFGTNSGIQFVYLPFSCLAFVLFELKDWKYIIIWILTSVFIFLECHLTSLGIPIYPVEVEIQQQIYFPMMLVVISLIILTIFYMSRESEHAEDAIEKAQKNFEIQIKEAREVVLDRNYSKKNSIADILKDQLAELKRSELELHNSNNYLERINIDLDNFVYTASHDLKSPISNIEGLINMLISHKSYTKDDVREIIDLMSLSVNKFKTTINELVEISKIEKGGQSEMEEIEFAELLEDVKFSINELIKISHAKITSDFRSAPHLRFSKKNLRSILYNLLSNAIKYKALDKAPIVHISTSIEADHVILQIEDNGLGISDDNIPKIFSMFKRVHNHVEGSGVGLYIVKKIIENNNGSITVESKVGKGSRFKLFFKIY